jgi:hypothetical protein
MIGRVFLLWNYVSILRMDLQSVESVPHILTTLANHDLSASACSLNSLILSLASHHCHNHGAIQ